MGFTESFTVAFLILFGIALVISAIGFYKYVYFISLGYGFSVAGIGIALVVMELMKGASVGDSLGVYLTSLLFIVYGCRLGGYLLVRELKSASYRNTMKKEIKDGSDMKMIAKLSIWISCALLYALQTSPVFFRMQFEKGTDTVSVIGAVIMLGGILFESTADMQKSIAKAKNPNRFCDSGLFKIVRCPNYLGEVLFWTGVFVSGITAYNGVWQWMAAIIGYVCIVYIMFGGARRLEIRQNKNYGSDLEYQEYVKRTPILIPFVPLYSVEKYKFLIG